MIQRFLRIALSSLALLLAIAGSLNVSRARAESGLCDGVCGCNGGPTQCCTWNGVTCYLTQIQQ